MKRLINKVSLGATSIALTTPFAAFAADTSLDTVPASAGNITVAQLLTKVINWVLMFAAAVAVLFLILGGLQYVTSAGNKDRIEKAKQTILYSVIGLIVIALSYAIVAFVSTNIKDAVV